MSEIKMKSSTFIFFLVVFAILVLVVNSALRFLPIGRFGELDQVASLISSNYVDKIEKGKLVRDGISGLVSDLDPYSGYLDRKELSGLLEESKGEFQGVGMEIGIRDGYPTVISPIEGSPAYKAGIKTGDKIVKINDISTRGLTGDEAQQKIRGPKESKVKLTILREGIKDSLEFILKRGVIEIRSVVFAGELEPGIGYARLARFSENAPDELGQALKELKAKNIKGLILDLRGNPGGLLQEAVGVAGLFLKKGELVVEIRGRKSSDSRKFHSEAQPVLEEVPLIVLVDFGSASASEIFAGAIQDLDRGIILGDTTFGKGAVQTLFELRDNTALKLTTAMYYIPSGRLIQKERPVHENPSGDTADVEARRAVPSGVPEQKAYHTRKGRKIYGEGGIVPDIVIPDPVFPLLVQKLLQGQYFFDFAVHYTAAHKNVPQDFQADDEVLKGFKDFVNSKGFEYKTSSESELDRLRETIKEEGKSSSESAESSNGIKDALNKLDNLLEEKKAAEFEKDKDFLKWQIEEAIRTKEFGSAERYKVWAKYQEQIKRAIEILKNKEEYKRFLSPT